MRSARSCSRSATRCSRGSCSTTHSRPGSEQARRRGTNSAHSSGTRRPWGAPSRSSSPPSCRPSSSSEPSTPPRREDPRVDPTEASRVLLGALQRRETKRTRAWRVRGTWRPPQSHDGRLDSTSTSGASIALARSGAGVVVLQRRCHLRRRRRVSARLAAGDERERLVIRAGPRGQIRATASRANWLSVCP